MPSRAGGAGIPSYLPAGCPGLPRDAFSLQCDVDGDVPLVGDPGRHRALLDGDRLSKLGRFLISCPLCHPLELLVPGYLQVLDRVPRSTLVPLAL